MTGRFVLLGLLIFCVAAEAADTGYPRQPYCAPPGKQFPLCPRNSGPVCGSNGRTYDNECLLCFERLETEVDIQVEKEGRC